MLKSSKFFFPVILTSFIIHFILLLLIIFTNLINNINDYKLFDFVYKIVLEEQLGPVDSDNIVYIVIDDDTYRDYFGKSIIDRNKFSDFLDTLALMSPSGVIIDIIFAYPQNSVGDQRLVETIKKINSVFLPISFSINSENSSTNLNSNNSFQKYKPIVLTKKGSSKYSVKADRIITQYDQLMWASRGIGHITESPDADGIFRHSNIFVEKDSTLIPALYLVAFLNYYEIPLDSVKINWGKYVEIPALENSWLEENVIIPIDKNAKTIIPYRAIWGRDYRVFSLKKFMENSRNEVLFNELSSMIEGRTILIGDVSTGIADISPTTLENSAPLITLQANMLNALFSRQFIKPVSKVAVYFISLLLSALISFFILIRNNIVSYLLCFLIIPFILLLTWAFLLELLIIPATSLLIYSAVYSGFLILTIQITSFKNQRMLSEKNIMIENEMEEARKVQLSMLPKNIPQIKGYELAVSMETASFVGGDYYDFFKNDDGSLTIILADATGHGLSAGTMVTVMKSLSLSINDYSDLHNYLNLLSKKIKILNLPKLYMCVAIYKISKNDITFSSAGIPPLLLFNENTIEEYLIKGPPLGFVNNFPYEIKTIKLKDGDLVLLFSDGIIEQFNKLEKMYGYEKLKLIASNNLKKTPSELVDLIMSDCKKWSGQANFSDDVTLLAIRKNSLV